MLMLGGLRYKRLLLAMSITRHQSRVSHVEMKLAFTKVEVVESLARGILYQFPALGHGAL